MPALPERSPRPEPEDNLVYVVPPWAVRGGTPADPSFWRAVVDFLAFEAKVLLGLIWVLAAGYYVLPELYEIKSRLGVDLLPGIHAPDVLPFLDRHVPEDPASQR